VVVRHLVLHGETRSTSRARTGALETGRGVEPVPRRCSRM
jgi:hypothetical protein